jgi:ribosome-associated translation inhibitor RaiA
MRIEVHDLRGDGEQTRAYAEYRVFWTLKHFGDIVRHAFVTLMPADQDHGRGGVVCRVTITMTNDRHVEATAHARHAYAAIDRVATRVQSLMARQPSAATRDGVAS